MYSPHMGQSQSVERSMHLCDVSMEVGIQAQHVWIEMFVSNGWRGTSYAMISHLAVHIVLPQPQSATADTAVVTVIDGFRRSILPQFTDAAVVLSSELAAVNAKIGYQLRGSAKHAEHVPCLEAGEFMIFLRVVA